MGNQDDMLFLLTVHTEGKTKVEKLTVNLRCVR